VAEGKVEGLLASEADVTVVSPVVTERLRQWIRRGRCRHVARNYQARDLAGRALALVATGNARVTARVHRDARRAGVLVNSADDPQHCDFILPAILRRGRLTVAVSTGGASPALARAVRDELERALPRSYAQLVEVVAEVRARARRHGAAVSPHRWQAAIDDRLRALVAEGRTGEAARLLATRLAASSTSWERGPGTPDS
jgi:precorrin-2 dehydrogenase